jgi:sugar lactone lactonase YvrE
LSVFHVSVGESGAAYITLHDNGGIYRVDAQRRLEPLGFPADAAVAVEAAGSVYALHGNRLLRRDASGRISPVADGFASPLGLAAGPDGDLFVADTGNGLIRRVNVRSGTTEIVASGLGYVVSVAVAADGTIWSSSAADRGRPGVWRITPGRPLTRVLAREVSAVTLGRDGGVYACAFRERRILRIDPGTDRAETFLRGG